MANEINVRELVLETLTDVDRGTKNASEAMSGTLRNYQYMSKQERSFYTRLCEGTIEYQIQLDYMINQVSKTPVRKCKPYIRNLLRMSLYQIRYMDAVPAEAACNEAVKLAKKKGFQSLSGFVNGVLRNLVRQQASIVFPKKEDNKVAFMSVTYSVPEWLAEKLLEWYPENVVEEMLKAFLQEAPLTVRVNLARTTKEEVEKILQADGIQTEHGFYTENTLRLSGINYMNRIKPFRQGLLTVQDESSVLQGYLIQPKPGDMILDVCAAPGGKSLHAAERLLLAKRNEQNQGLTVEAATEHVGQQGMEQQASAQAEKSGMVIARDVSDGKIQRIQENLERMEYSNLQVEVWDALTLDESKIQSADIVIADVPCSGLGVIGRKQDIKYRVTKEQLTELKMLQQQILSIVSQYVKPGGQLIYSTCTVNPEENEQQVAWMQKTLGLEAMNIEGRLPRALVECVKGQPGTDLEQGYCTLLPGQQQCDGFFFAVLQRVR